MTAKNTPIAAEQVIAAYTQAGCVIATAESCTGGLIAAALTAIPGSSAVVDRGFVVYSNQAKQDLLNVSSSILDEFGAVSEQTARAMVQGALQNSPADAAVAVTGIAGPGGGSDEKPVGTVFLAASLRNGQEVCRRKCYTGDRDQIRQETVKDALFLLMELIIQKK